MFIFSLNPSTTCFEVFNFKHKSVLTKWCLYMKVNPSQLNLKIGMWANYMIEILDTYNKWMIQIWTMFMGG